MERINDMLKDILASLLKIEKSLETTKSDLEEIKEARR